MKLIQNDFELTIQLLSSIWLRKPIIISINSESRAIPMLEELLSLIPEYRQLILCGPAPKNILWQRRNTKTIEDDNLPFVYETLFSSLNEEKVGNNFPLQIIYFNASHKIFKNILGKIDRGWIAISLLSLEDMRQYFKSRHFEIFHSREYAVTFFIEKSTNCVLERKILEKIKNRSDTATAFLIQKKFAEIRYAGKALVREIETGQPLYQVEMQELFEMDSFHFDKSLEVLAAEQYLDAVRYIHFPSPKLQEALDQISRIAGVIWVCALFENHILGLSKSPMTDNLPLSSLPKFYNVINRVSNFYEIGSLYRLKIDLDDGHQLLFLHTFFPEENKNFVFGILTEAGTYAVLLFNKIEIILNKNQVNES